MRDDRPGWVVYWSPLHGEFRARPPFRAPPGTLAAAVTPGDLITRMDQIENARQTAAEPASPEHKESTP